MHGEDSGRPGLAGTCRCSRRALLSLSGLAALGLLSGCAGQSPTTSGGAAGNAPSAASPASAAPAPGAQPATAPAPAPAAQSATAVPAAAASKPATSSTLDTLTIVQGADVVTMDYTKTASMFNFVPIFSVVDPLLRLSKTEAGKLEPVLATSWEQVEPTRWRFKLREGVKFHNGKELTAEAVKWSIERQANDGAWKAAINMVDHVDVVDKHTADIILKYPSGLFLLGLNAVSFIMEPEWGTSADFSSDKAIGTGPYKFVEWSKGQRVALEANPDYWMGPPPSKRLIWRPIPEASTRVAALLAGEVDLIRQVPPQDVERVNASKDVEVATVNGNRCTWLNFRDDLPPTDDQRVRQAINYAVDVDAIIKSVLGGYAKKLEGQTTSDRMWGWNPDVKAYPYDPEKAKQLLKEAGVADGTKIKIDTPRGRWAQDVEVSNAVAGYLKRVGLDAEVEINENAAFDAKYNRQASTNHMVFTSSGHLIADQENTLRDLLLGWDTPGSMGIRSAKLRDLNDQLAKELDVGKRRELGMAAAQEIHDYAVGLFLYQNVDLYGKKRTLDWTPRSDEWILPMEIKPKAV